VYNTGGKGKGGVGGNMGYIDSSSGDFLVQGSNCEFCWLTNKNGPAFILQNYQAPHERQASRRDLVHAERTVLQARRCSCIIHHLYRSDLVHLGAN